MTKLVHIVDDVPELEGADRPVLVVALEGFLDAGKAAGVATDQLLRGDPDGPVVATLDVDEFYDYRARRPGITFAIDHYAGYEAPRLVVRALRDEQGTPYLLLTGPEPDSRWEAFLTAVRAVVERFDVGLVVSMGSVPMAVPHTRPIAITPHANDASLITVAGPWRTEMKVPASAQALLELRLGEWGYPAQGFVAHVPHYIAQLAYPRASVALLEAVLPAAGLEVDLQRLRSDAETTEGDIARFLADNPEVAGVVAGLEQQYDAFSRAEDEGASLLADDRPLPSGDEIGEQVEQFLAGLDRPDQP